MTNPVPEVYTDAPERGVRGWVKPDLWVKPPEKMISQCCCLRDLVHAIETDSTPVLSPEHARHILEIMCKIPEAIETGKTIELVTDF